jgi:ABC-type transporter MlaC component
MAKSTLFVTVLFVSALFSTGLTLKKPASLQSVTNDTVKRLFMR